MAIAGDVFNQVAAFMDDPERDVMTDSYLAPFLNLCNKRLYQNVYANPNIQGAKSVVVIPNVPAGTSSLNSYMQPGQPLALLTNVFSMWEKQAGSQDSDYMNLVPMYELPLPSPNSVANFNGVYVMAKEDILLPGANQALDIRIFGEFKPVNIESADTPLLPNTEQILTHWVCEIVGMTRGATREFIAFHGNEKQQAIAELFNSLIMDIQNIPVQQRPFNNQTGWFNNFNTNGF